MLERKLEPSAVAAISMDLGLGPAAGLRFELGDRVSRSPVVPLTSDASGTVTAGEPNPMVVHRVYASVGLQLHTRYIWNHGRDTSKAVPLIAADVGGGTAPLIKERAGSPGALTVSNVLDGLGAGQQNTKTKPLPVKAVAPVTPVDSARPRPIGSDGFYDVVLDIPNVSVDEITLEVNN